MNDEILSDHVTVMCPKSAVDLLRHIGNRTRAKWLSKMTCASVCSRVRSP